MRNSAVILGLLFTTLVIAAPTAEPRMPFRADVGGEGPAIIFIPGLNSSGDVWDGLVRGLRNRYTCHVLTLAGFAGEPPIDPPFLPAIREAVLQYIQDQRLQQPVIVGHSLGGLLALWLGAIAPTDVGRIITIDGVPFLPALTNPASTIESVRPMAQGMRDAFLRTSPSERRATRRCRCP
jgi:N-formylmaleamate deformylase